jgi:hypothetical protein
VQVLVQVSVLVLELRLVLVSVLLLEPVLAQLADMDIPEFLHTLCMLCIHRQQNYRCNNML